VKLTLIAKNLEFLTFYYKSLLLIEILKYEKSKRTQKTFYRTLKQFFV
jgi:hypothetical protein